ncbi:MAG TPA: hypothetical protein VK709_03190 [Candidatus Saccharimonadales bacterium]|jgi:hypothetical protein|nr:hypothetical protein [Candidatus Saccharimonadales bacterium]
MVWLGAAAVFVLFAGACCFLALLIRYDMTPRAALYKISNRLGIDSKKVNPEEQYGPYKRLKPLRPGLQRPVLLNLETSDGSGQAVHPDVAYIGGGFGADKWTYWMACTPYPYGNAYHENPEIFASHDGTNWTVPSGLKNPQVPSLQRPGDHNSDPDILFYQNELWLFYRETLRSKTPNENRIFLLKSVDGIHWSPRMEVLSESQGKELLSPAVIHNGTCFVMWTIEIISGKLTLMRRCSSDGVYWMEPVQGTLTGLQAPQSVWHIDVIQEEEQLSAVLVSCVGMGGAGAKIHYAASKDGGLNWTVDDLQLEQNYEFESGFHYRASLRRRAEEENHYDLWYTAATQKRMYSIAYLRMVREGNKLLPICIGRT